MGSFTDHLESELLDHVLNSATYTPAATIYLALGTADPTDAATGASMNEVADAGSYARKAITFGAASSRAVTQNANVPFGTATADWGTVTHWAIVDSATHGAGNALAHGSLSPTKVILNGNIPSVASGQVVISFTAGEISNYLADELLDHAFRNSAYTVPGTVWTALATASIADATTGSTIGEPSGNGYARVQVNVNGGAAPTWDLAASSVVDNGGTINFGTASGSWGTVVGVAIIDASTNGNLLFYDLALVDQPVTTSDWVYFNPGEFDVVMS